MQPLPLIATLLLVMHTSANAGPFGSAQRTGAAADCMKRYSKAWCVWDAANMSEKLDDVPRGKLEKALQEGGLKAVDLAYITGMATGILRPFSFGTKWTDISTVLLGVVLERKPPVIGFNKVLAWMPYEMAASPDEADEVMANLVLKATKAALPEHTLEPSVRRVNPLKAKNLFDATWDENHGWELVGPDCPPGQCWMWNNPHGHPQPEPPKEGRAPEWLGGYRAWVFDLKSGRSMLELWTGKGYESMRYANALSRALPDWAFLSITPEHEIFSGSKLPPIFINAGVRMPIVMNRGQSLLPVFPEISTGNGDPK
jgi:hypothetical protein